MKHFGDMIKVILHVDIKFVGESVAPKLAFFAVCFHREGDPMHKHFTVLKARTLLVF